MNQALVDTIVQAVLYEGYILYPYRASAKKNRQRFTFGRVYPEAYHDAQNGAEPCLMQTECVVETGPPGSALDVIVRFLHPMAREIGRLEKPLDVLPDEDTGFFELVPELEIDGHLYPAWHEAVERVVRLPRRNLERGACLTSAFSFLGSRQIEPIYNAEKKIAAVIVRRQEPAQGQVEVCVTPAGPAARITVRIVNCSAVPAAELNDQNAIVMRTFASTHTILHAVDGAAFVSQIDPPKPLAGRAAACRQIGTWPVLVGDETKAERDTMISSPIILYDYPKIAPESPGNLFDGGEIDEILTLRIMTLTDDEKREMRRIDGQAREILERTEALPQDALLRLHGAMRETAPTAAATEEFFNPATKPATVTVQGVALRTGDRVRVRPKSRADIMDMAFDGKIAIIETIEQDAEDKIHLALILEDDPGRDLGFLRQPGHRFFYGADEIEPLREGE